MVYIGYVPFSNTLFSLRLYTRFSLSYGSVEIGMWLLIGPEHAAVAALVLVQDPLDLTILSCASEFVSCHWHRCVLQRQRGIESGWHLWLDNPTITLFRRRRRWR